MGVLTRLLGGRPDEAAVARAVHQAVAAAPGVTGVDVSYNHQQYAGGALTGVVELADRDALEVALAAATQALLEHLGADTDRVTVYLTGRVAGGATVAPGDLGLPQPPTGRDLRRHFGAG